MNTPSLLTDIGTFQVDPNDLWEAFIFKAMPEAEATDRFDGIEKLSMRGGDEGRKQARRPVLKMEGGCFNHCFLRSLQEIPPATSVDLEINETWNEEIPTKLDHLCVPKRFGPERMTSSHFEDQAILDDQIAVLDLLDGGVDAGMEKRELH
jgi:hypothetical protein